tara:strand:- start:18706 stop:19977 length:1272 start_codon:yes stop_codon:yes gene_type:complete
MKNFFQLTLLSLYFFVFLINESLGGIYLSWDRIIPQFLFLSILNTLSFAHLLRNNRLLLSISYALKEKIIICYSLFIATCFVSIFFAANYSESIIVFSQYLTYLLSFIAIYSLSKSIGKTFLQCFILFSGSALFIESSSILYNAIDQVLINGEIFERNNFMLRTFTGNINIAANSIVSKIMIVYLIIYTYKDKRLIYLSYALLFIAFSALFILLTRSAFLSLGILTLVLVSFNYKKIITRSVPLLVIVLIGYFFVNSTFNTENPDEISSRINSITLNTEDDSINERLGYYSDAVKSIMQYPVFGIGIGNWKIKSIEYSRNSIPGYVVPYHVHNDFLQISAEIGIIGGLLYLMIYLIPIYHTVIKLKDGVLDNLNLVYLLIISAILIDSMLNFPIARPVNHIFLLFTLVAMLQTSKTDFNDEST